MNVIAKRLIAIIAGMGLLAAAAGAGAMLIKTNNKPTEPIQSVSTVSVAVSAVERKDFETVVRISGNVKAANRARVSARIPGTLDAIYVDEGDRVTAGKTPLFRTDAVKLTKALEVARQQLAVARCAVRERQAALEQVQANHEQNVIDMKRYEGLYDRGNATKREAELQQLQLKRSQAALKHGQAVIELAQAQQAQARSQVTMAEKDLADSIITSPIDGRVCQRLCEPGEMAGAGTPVLEIEDPSVLEVSAWLPQAYYARVRTGQTVMRVGAAGVTLGARKVSYKSPTIHTRLRTFEVRCVVTDGPAGVVAGAIADIAVVLEQKASLGVPTGAITTRAGGSVVFVVDGHAVRMVHVTTGLETDGWVEIVGGGLEAGMHVVTVGRDFLDDGSTVTVVEGT